MGSLSHRNACTIQRALQQTGEIDGWLFYDFRHSDPISYRILRLDPHLHVTRRWYYWIPCQGQPVKLLHRIEPLTLAELPGESRFYVSWDEQQTSLRRMLAGARTVAMQYSPMNAIPYLSRVDAGTLELIRSFGIHVVTSADLVQQFEAVWDEHQLATHKDAAGKLRRIVDQAFGYVRERISSRLPLTEYDVQQFILCQFKERELITSSAPIAAVNAHSADPHYGPLLEGSLPIREGDLLLIDLWAKRPEPGSVYADITWTGFVGRTVPHRHQDIFHIVRMARDEAVRFVREHVSHGQFPCGWQVDDICRSVIDKSGYGQQFVHRTGHSIGEEVHGNGANIDNLETRDSRRLMPRTCFSIEPGIYLPGEFGIRSELDVYLSDHDAVVYGQPIQTELIPILAS